MGEGKIVLITGGSRGIGAATARLAASQGYAVGINYKSDHKSAQQIANEIEKGGGKAVAIQGDMAQEADVERVFATLDSSLGRLTHLVYNSGITGAPSRVEAVTTSTMREVFDLNLLGAFLCVRAAIPRMSKLQGNKGGSIVLLSSIAARLGGPGEYTWYAASKAGIDAMTTGLSIELAGDEIRVNAVAPGLIETEIHAAGRLARLSPNVPMKRVGAPSEVAEAIMFLLSDASSYTTGAVLTISGGR